MMTFLVLGAGLTMVALAYTSGRLATANIGRGLLSLQPATRFGGEPQPDESETADPAWASFMRAM